MAVLESQKKQPDLAQASPDHEPIDLWISNAYCNQSSIQNIPITITSSSQPQTFVTSITSQFIRYATAEAKVGFLGPTLANLFSSLDDCVLVNNGLLTTTPKLLPSSPSLQTLSHELQNTYPNYAIVFRGLHESDFNEQALKRDGFCIIPTRPVYLFDGVAAGYLKKEVVKRESKKFSIHDVLPLQTQSSDRVQELYEALYIQKHSRFNPRYTKAFFERAMANPMFCFYGIYGENKMLDAFIALREDHTGLTVPFLGYDLSKENLYRHVFLKALHEAAARKRILNFSSGAGEFKRRRGGVKTIEYTAASIKHLSTARQLQWRALESICKKYALPYFKRSDI